MPDYTTSPFGASTLACCTALPQDVHKHFLSLVFLSFTFPSRGNTLHPGVGAVLDMRTSCTLLKRHFPLHLGRPNFYMAMRQPTRTFSLAIGLICHRHRKIFQRFVGESAILFMTPPTKCSLLYYFGDKCGNLR